MSNVLLLWIDDEIELLNKTLSKYLSMESLEYHTKFINLHNSNKWVAYG